MCHDQRNSTGISTEWLAWLRDYGSAASKFTNENPVPVGSEEERELVALKLALFARAVTLFEGALLLIENDRQLDFRVHIRGVVEAAMYLIALDRSPDIVTVMKNDEHRSRHSRAQLHLKANDFDKFPDIKRVLEEYVAQGSQGAKAIRMETLLDGSEFERLYRTYREISADAAHVSVTSLNRHYVENPESSSALIMLHPELDNFEMRMTLSELGVSMLIATFVVMKVKEKTELWQEFQTLQKRYRALAAGTH